MNTTYSKLIIEHAEHRAASSNPVVFRPRTRDSKRGHEISGMSGSRQSSRLVNVIGSVSRSFRVRRPLGVPRKEGWEGGREGGGRRDRGGDWERGRDVEGRERDARWGGCSMPCMAVVV